MTSNLILHLIDITISFILLVVAIVRNSMDVKSKSRWFVTFVATLNVGMAIWIFIMYLFYCLTGGMFWY